MLPNFGRGLICKEGNQWLQLRRVDFYNHERRQYLLYIFERRKMFFVFFERPTLNIFCITWAQSRSCWVFFANILPRAPWRHWLQMRKMKTAMIIIIATIANNNRLAMMPRTTVIIIIASLHYIWPGRQKLSRALWRWWSLPTCFVVWSLYRSCDIFDKIYDKNHPESIRWWSLPTCFVVWSLYRSWKFDEQSAALSLMRFLSW